MIGGRQRDRLSGLSWPVRPFRVEIKQGSESLFKLTWACKLPGQFANLCSQADHLDGRHFVFPGSLGKKFLPLAVCRRGQDFSKKDNVLRANWPLISANPVQIGML